jgi:hypothetical protein
MEMLSRWLDRIAQRQFVKDASGQMVFLPRGPRHSCYYVDAADESKLKPLVRTYAIAAALINLTGSLASLGFTGALSFDHGSLLPEKFKFALTIYLICSVLFLIAPLLVLFRVYRDALAELCTCLAVADRASLRLVPTNSKPIRIWIVLLVAGLILLGLIFFLMVTRQPV